MVVVEEGTCLHIKQDGLQGSETLFLQISVLHSFGVILWGGISLDGVTRVPYLGL